MNRPMLFTCLLLVLGRATSEEISIKTSASAHREGASQVADRQDELSADVQQLKIEQTVPQVIELFNDVEKIMDEATEQLASGDTGGRTIATQTEVIEMIHAAAKEKQKQQGSGQSGGAMMDMMERMMGKSPDADKDSKGEGAGSSDQGGEGANGAADVTAKPKAEPAGAKGEARRVPKASGNAGHELPDEFTKILDAYNRGAEQKQK